MKEKKLKIHLLGAFTLEYNNKILALEGHQGEKVWKMLAYLLMRRGDEVPAEELYLAVEGVPPNGDPARLMKNLLYRLRKLLDELDFMPGNYMILYDQGFYSWNMQIKCDIDLDNFWSWIDRAEESRTNSQKMHYYRNALHQYQGELLVEFFYFPWLQAQREWIRNAYRKSRNFVIDVLMQKGDWEDVMELCRDLYRYDDESLPLQQAYLEALLKTDRQKEAVSFALALQDIWEREYCVSMVEVWPDIYNALDKSDLAGFMDLTVLQNQLEEDEPNLRLFYVDMGVFKSAYHLTLRNAERYHINAYLCQISLIGGDWEAGEDGFQKQQEWMERTLSRCLRKGDLAANYCPNEYLLLLTVEDVVYLPRIFRRIADACKASKPGLELNVQYEGILEEILQKQKENGNQITQKGNKRTWTTMNG